MKSIKTWLALAAIAGLAAFAWSQRHGIEAWYQVRQLTLANLENREVPAKKVALLGEAALPRLLDGLQSQDAIVCSNMQYALFLIAKQWGVADPKSQHMTERFQACFGQFSPAGQEKVVLLLTGLLQLDGPRPLPPPLTKTISEVLMSAEKTNELRGPALLLAAELIVCVQPGQWVDVCRDMAERGLKDEMQGSRIAALQLLRRTPMHNKELLEKAVPLLQDEKAPVRRAALLALAGETELLREEQFLPLLHDDDAEVQYLCEIALRRRGLTDAEIDLARLIGAKSPVTRMRVLHHFSRLSDLNLGEWLLRLSNDPAPAVRAAAVRAAGDYPRLDMTARLREMAERDPSDTVRENARYYLGQRMTAQR